MRGRFRAHWRAETFRRRGSVSRASAESRCALLRSRATRAVALVVAERGLGKASSLRDCTEEEARMAAFAERGDGRLDVALGRSVVVRLGPMARIGGL